MIDYIYDNIYHMAKVYSRLYSLGLYKYICTVKELSNDEFSEWILLLLPINVGFFGSVQDRSHEKVKCSSFWCYQLLVLSVHRGYQLPALSITSSSQSFFP